MEMEYEYHLYYMYISDIFFIHTFFAICLFVIFY